MEHWLDLERTIFAHTKLSNDNLYLIYFVFIEITPHPDKLALITLQVYWNMPD